MQNVLALSTRLLWVCWGLLLLFCLQKFSGQTRCPVDGEGTWKIGLFVSSDSRPFIWEAIERSVSALSSLNFISGGGTANPILQCEFLGSQVNYVSKPFLIQRNPGSDEWHLFFEMKSTTASRTQIGVAVSQTNGLDWKYIGVALAEARDLSYPYVFTHKSEIFMIPDSPGSNSVRMYSAMEGNPAHFILDSVLLPDVSLTACSMIHTSDTWYLFGSNSSGLYLHYADDLRGIWRSHPDNPVGKGRTGGRIIQYLGEYYRFVRMEGELDLQMRKISQLSRKSFAEQSVPQFVVPRTHWNSLRFGHMDAHLLPNGRTWIAVTDGDNIAAYSLTFYESVQLVYHIVISLFITLTMYFGFQRGRVSLLQPVKCKWTFLRLIIVGIILLAIITVITICIMERDYLIFWEYDNIIYNNEVSQGFRARDPHDGQHKGYTMVLLTHGRTPDGLYPMLRHFAQCLSCTAIEIVYNPTKDIMDPPSDALLNNLREDYGIPVYVRISAHNSLNARFEPLEHSAWNTTMPGGAILSIDRDIRVPCYELEIAFQEWLRAPERIVGLYPRLIYKEESKYIYGNEDKVRRFEQYNAILTNVAFVRSDFFEYSYASSPEASLQLVEKHLNCEDILMNFAVANITHLPPLYVEAAVVQIRKGETLSARANHLKIRMGCVNQFVKDFGYLPLRTISL